MIVAKQVADIVTSLRVLLAFCLVYLGLTQGAAGLPIAVWLMIADWAGDFADGRIARRSRIQYHTWIGDHDLEVDMIASMGLLVYMSLSGFASLWVVLVYVLMWGMYFWRQAGIPRSQGMLFQTPIYAWFIWVALNQAPRAGWAIVIFIGFVLASNWQYFLKVVVPGFLSGFNNGPAKQS